ncbi:MAG: hypothetical protein PHP41_02725 [Bacilli bacterium]|jgi:hypothetical protein|nr:hypothetical protein [Bacilli bacterium]MDY0063492.1 hypothetical protein [Bacilli bacterium]
MYYQKNIIAIIAIILFYIFGVFFILIDPSLILRITLMGISFLLLLVAALIFIYLPSFPEKMKNRKIVEAVFMIIVALLMILFYSEVTRIILGLYLIAVPVAHIIEYKGKDKLHFDILKIIIGILLIISFEQFIAIAMIVLGCGLLIGATMLLFLLLKNRKERSIPNILVKYFMKR